MDIAWTGTCATTTGTWRLHVVIADSAEPSMARALCGVRVNALHREPPEWLERPWRAPCRTCLRLRRAWAERQP